MLPDHDFPLYFARHGETVFNAQGRYQGARDDSALTVRGRKQARAIGMLFGKVAAGQTLPRFISSPLKRARTTMEIILEALSLPANGYTTDRRLTEIDLGHWSGQPIETIKINDADNWNARERDKWNIPIPGGESYAMVAERVRDWYREITAETFVISHGGFGRILRGLYDDLSWQDISALDEPQGVIFRFQAGAITRIGEPAAPPA